MRKLMDFSNVTVTVLTGAYLALLSLFATDGLRSVPDGLVASGGLRLVFFLVGAVLVGMNIHILVREWKAGGLRNNLRITTEQGTTEVSVPSMEMILLRDLKAEADITDPVVILKPRGEGKPMLCEVTLKLRRQEDVIKRIDGIKRKVRDVIDRLIPGGFTVEVMVEVRDFVSGSIRTHRDNQGEAGDGFNGPVYSDGGGTDGV